MQPMIRPNKPATPPIKRFSGVAVTVLAVVMIVTGVLSLPLGEISTAVFSWVAAAMLLLIQGIAMYIRAANEQLETLNKEMSAMRQLLAITVMRGNPGAKGEHESEQRKTTPEGAHPVHRGAVPQPAGD
jgi:cobalamin biosynthesis protein CobD/CbiB